MVEKKIEMQQTEVMLTMGSAELAGFLCLPADAKGIVLFVHGSGSSYRSPRNRQLAQFLNEENVATLLFDLLTPQEEEIDNITREMRFNIPFLAERLKGATEWISGQPEASHLTCGYFGASTGAAAALIAAAEWGERIKAIVCRGGRPDLAGHALQKVIAPTLLIVGSNDYGVVELNRHCLELLNCPKKIELIAGASHLFEEPGALEQVGHVATRWFEEHL